MLTLSAKSEFLTADLFTGLAGGAISIRMLMYFLAAGSGGATKDSRPKSPRKLNVSSVSAVSSKPQVTKARGLPEENTNLRNGDYIKPYAEETCFVEDSLTIEEQNKFSHLILVSANSLKVCFWRTNTHRTELCSSFS